jgi:hypothetical protein
MQEMIDKRHSRRIGCRILSWFRTIAEGGFSGYSTTVSDISEGGVRFRSSEPLSPNDNYYLFLEIPGRASIDSYVKPVWSWKSPHSNEYETGASFVKIHPEDQGIIRQLVSSKL